MNQSPFLKVVVVLSIGAIILFPIYTVLIQYPAFTKLLAENTTKEAERIATNLSSILIAEQADLTEADLPKNFLRYVSDLQKDSRIVKLKIFLPSGRVIFSTDPLDIGATNEEEYFRRIIMTGSGYAKEVEKNTQSLEKQVMPADVVETYVPIMNKNRMIGVFEIYYDITAEKNKLRGLIKRSAGALFSLAVVLLAGVLVSVYKAGKMARERKRMEDALIESEKRYRLLFEHAADAIFILESTGESAGKIVAANQAAVKMHGYTAEELSRMKIMDLDTPESAQRAPDLIRRMLDGEWIKTEITHQRKDGTVFPVEVSAGLLELGEHKYILAIDRDITIRRQIDQGREKLIRDLQDALEKLRTLKGMLPICSSCKKIRDDKGYWSQIEAYISSHSEAEFTHGICPDCAKKLYPEIDEKENEST